MGVAEGQHFTSGPCAPHHHPTSAAQTWPLCTSPPLLTPVPLCAAPPPLQLHAVRRAEPTVVKAEGLVARGLDIVVAFVVGHLTDTRIINPDTRGMLLQVLVVLGIGWARVRGNLWVLLHSFAWP